MGQDFEETGFAAAQGHRPADGRELDDNPARDAIRRSGHHRTDGVASAAPGGLRSQRRAADTHAVRVEGGRRDAQADRKSTRLNSSHLVISYAVFCLKKKITAGAVAYRH